ncbi:alpha/beta fold hydrolase [Streptomyces sp. NPDC001739]|uniref:alpha/beta fold hydrolase n=1 Tax=Streptomyces TaxID=1883 RepID=UPI0027DBB11A|nr:alpha/beta hydrolase [Streptomyces sp. 9-7]
MTERETGTAAANGAGAELDVRTVRTPTLDTAYAVSGPETGRPVVAVHGWPDDIHCWDGVLPALHTAGCRVYRPYLRGFGPTRFRDPARPRSGQIAALGSDLGEFLDALDLADVVLAGHDWGARAAYVVGALWPERVRAIAALSAGYATHRPDAPLPYALAQAYWYEWFVATGRGRRAMVQDRRAFCHYLWRAWSPGWDFSQEEFDATAAAWDNDDWADVTVHAYLHRWGEAPGDPAYDTVEERLAAPAPIQVPTIVLHGAEDADNLLGTTAGKQQLFADGYTRQVLGGVGHFPPREAPEFTAEAILSLC